MKPSDRKWGLLLDGLALLAVWTWWTLKFGIPALLISRDVQPERNTSKLHVPAMVSILMNTWSTFAGSAGLPSICMPPWQAHKHTHTHTHTHTQARFCTDESYNLAPRPFVHASSAAQCMSGEGAGYELASRLATVEVCSRCWLVAMPL